MNRANVGNRRRYWRTLTLCATLAFSTGCTEWTGGGFERFEAELVQLRDQLAEDQAVWEQRLASLPENDPARLLIEAEGATAAAQLAAVDAAITQAELVRAEAEIPTDPLSSLIGAVVPWLPEPVRTPLVLGGALIVTAARARQLKRGAASIATSLRRVMADDPQFADKFREHASTLRAIQTPTAARIVDEADTSRQLVRLPI